MSEPTEVEQAAEKKRIRASLDVLGSYYDESTGKIDGRRMMNEIATLKRQRDMLLEVLKANEAFITEMVTFGGKYSFLSGTDIIPDAYAQLKQISVAIAAVEWEK